MKRADSPVAGMTNAEKIRYYRELAAAQGLCYTCRCRPKTETSRYCAECLASTREYAIAQRARRIRQRVCAECGEERPRGMRRCEACNTRSLAASRSRHEACIADGICTRCGDRPLAPNRKKCVECLAAGKERTKAYQTNLLARGVCSTPGCGRRLSSKWYCEHHLKLLREAGRSRYAARGIPPRAKIEDTVDAVAKLRLSGAGIRAIADRLGLSTSHVSKCIGIGREMGIEIPRLRVRRAA